MKIKALRAFRKRFNWAYDPKRKTYSVIDMKLNEAQNGMITSQLIIHMTLACYGFSKGLKWRNKRDKRRELTEYFKLKNK